MSEKCEICGKVCVEPGFCEECEAWLANRGDFIDPIAYREYLSDLAEADNAAREEAGRL